MSMIKIRIRQLLPLIFFVLFASLMSLPVLAEHDSKKPDNPRSMLDNKDLVDALVGGGYVIYFRHGKTDHSTFDTDRVNMDDCSKQRLLSEEGRQQMREIGHVIAQLGIRASRVLSSPYCRSIDTAVLAFGSMEITEDLKHTVDADENTADRRSHALRKILGTMPVEAGTNTILSSHTANLLEGAGIWPKPEGVAVIFKPTGDGGFNYIATVPPKKWQKLANLK